MKRIHITWTFEFGEPEPEEEVDIQPGGDVFTSSERRPSEDHKTPHIGFGREGA